MRTDPARTGEREHRAPGATARPERAGFRRIMTGSLAALILVVYLGGVHPGVAEGDSAELQWAGPLLGICHSPGYALQVTALKIFTALPLGGTPAWRANLMSVLMGIIGALALFGAVRRVTGSPVAAWVSAATLAFSTVYWSLALVAEVYVFGGAFICLAAYSAVRFVTSDDARWMGVAAVCLGIVVAERPSEVLILPAFLVLWIGFRREARIDLRRVLASVSLVVLPFVAAVVLNMMRANPNRLAVQDDLIRDGIPGVDLSGEVTYDYGAGPGLVDRTRAAVVHVLGLRWAPNIGAEEVPLNLKKLVWLLGGLGIAGDSWAPAGQHDPLLSGGVTVGLPGLLLAALGAFLWRGRWQWVVFGLLLLAGNLLFVIPYFAFDSMTFLVPGLIGLAFLVGLGCARPDAGTASSLGYAALLLPLGLLLVNHGYVNRNTPKTRAFVNENRRLAEADWPRDSVILSTYWFVTTLRYDLRVETARPDILIIHLGSDSLSAAASYFQATGRPTFMAAHLLPVSSRRVLAGITPPELLKLGYLYLDPDAIGF